MRGSHVGVELPYEAGEVVVLEVARQEVALEGVRVPDHEAGASAGAPRDDGVGGRVGDHVVDLGEERGDVRRPGHHRRDGALPRGWGADVAGRRGGGGLRRPLLGAHGDGARISDGSRLRRPVGRDFGWVGVVKDLVRLSSGRVRKMQERTKKIFNTSTACQITEGAWL
jgi:hypothetical protein